MLNPKVDPVLLRPIADWIGYGPNELILKDPNNEDSLRIGSIVKNTTGLRCTSQHTVSIVIAHCRFRQQNGVLLHNLSEDKYDCAHYHEIKVLLS